MVSGKTAWLVTIEVGERTKKKSTGKLRRGKGQSARIESDVDEVANNKAAPHTTKAITNSTRQLSIFTKFKTQMRDS